MLKSLFAGTPKWQSPNLDERLAAVAELASDDSALATMATSDISPKVRAAAIARCEDVALLRNATDDVDSSVRDAASTRWATLAVGTAPDENLPLAVLAAILRDDTSGPWHDVAMRRAAKDLPSWLTTGAPLPSKLNAIAQATDLATLEHLHRYWRDHDRRLGKACGDRLEQLRAEDRNAQEADVLLAQMQSWHDADEVPLTRLVDAQRSWAKLTVDGDRQAIFDRVIAGLQHRMQNEAASRRMHEALAMQIAGLSLKSKRAAELASDELITLAADATQAQGSPVLDAGLAQQLQQVHAAVAREQQARERNAVGEALLATMPASAGLTIDADSTEPIESAEKAKIDSPVLAQEAADADAPDPSGADSIQAMPSASAVRANTDSTGASHVDAHAEWLGKWNAWLATVDAETRERFEQRLQASLGTVAATKPTRTPIARADDSDLATAKATLDKLAELIAAGDVRGARHNATKLFQQFTAKRFPKPEEQRLHQLDGEVKRLESWLRWSDGQARDALTAKVEALKESPLPPDQLAKEVRAIQEEWKALDKTHGGAPKPKWDKFNALCKVAYAPAKAHFDALRKQRVQNASGREKIIEAMIALAKDAESKVADALSQDWHAIEARKSDLFEQWKKAGGVANAAWKTLDKQFDDALKQLDTALDAAREPEIARRRRLIIAAEELARAEPSRETTDATITLQRRWSSERAPTLPHLRRKDEQRLWDEFKKHTDAVFKARDSQRDQVKAQFSEATKARFAIIDELRALVNAEDGKLIDAGLASARAQWRGLPAVERERSRDMERKFDDAVALVRRRAALLARGTVVAAMQQTLGRIGSADSSDKVVAASIIDAELIAGVDSPPEIAAARRMQQLRWLSERRQLPGTADARISALRTLLESLGASGAKISNGERQRLDRAIAAAAAS